MNVIFDAVKEAAKHHVAIEFIRRLTTTGMSMHAHQQTVQQIEKSDVKFKLIDAPFCGWPVPGTYSNIVEAATIRFRPIRSGPTHVT